MPIPLIAAESSGLASLGINLPALIFELINFGILFWILKRYAYKPIVDGLENRRKKIEESLKAAEAAQAEKASIEAERTKIIAEARKHAAEIVADARNEGETKKNEIIKEAEATAEHIVEQAKRETDRQLAAAHDQLLGEAKRLVVSATAALIEEKLDEKRDAELIDKAFKKATIGGKRG
jgi:F-type H+-transporting ATPase subunit b